MPRPIPEEFRRDVVAVAGKSDRSMASVAKADVEDGVRPGMTTEESAELRQLRQRNRQLGAPDQRRERHSP